MQDRDRATKQKERESEKMVTKNYDILVYLLFNMPLKNILLIGKPLDKQGTLKT